MDMVTDTTITDLGGNIALVRLMTWLSPAFPVGAFAYSGGLETAIANGHVSDAAGLARWMRSLGEHGYLKTDSIFFSLSYRAEDEATLRNVNELALALAGSAERLLETRTLGGAFLQAARAWACAPCDWLGANAAYPVAVGAVAGAHETGLEAGLSAYMHAALSQLVSVAIRCGVCGQREGVSILGEAERNVLLWARQAAAANEDDLGSSTIVADITAMRHETQTTRLFRS